MLLAYCGMEGLQPNEFVLVISTKTAGHWKSIVDLFVGKSEFLCEFQYRNLKRTSERVDPWAEEEDVLLRECVK